MTRFTKIPLMGILYPTLFCCFFLSNSYSQLVISEISPNAEVEALEQYGGGEWFEICNVGQFDMDISGYTVGHYEDASFGQSDFHLGMENDNCDCGGSYGVIKFTGHKQSQDVILPAGECLIITGQAVDCGDAYYCLNARDLLFNGPTGIVQQYNSSRNDYPGSGNGNGRGALEGHYWRQKNYECNAYYIWNADNEIIDAVNFNCLPQSGPDKDANDQSGGFHYPDGNGGYHSYPPAFPTPPAQGPFPVGIEITNSDYTWMGESIEEGVTFQRCTNNPNFVFPPLRYDPLTGSPMENYYPPTRGKLNSECCSDCDNNDFFQGIQLPACTNGSAVGLTIEENEQTAEAEIASSSAPSCNNSESRLRSNYDENTISFCTNITTPNFFDKPYIGFVNSLDEIFASDECSQFTGADIFNSVNCEVQHVDYMMSDKGRPIFALEENASYTLCFNYNISACGFKNRMYWDNPCFSPFYCVLEVQCPEIMQDTFNCLSDVPAPLTDTIGLSQLGGEVVSSCSEVIVTSVDSLGEVSGPKNQRILYRTYTFFDGMTEQSCTIQYFIINRVPPILMLSADTLYLTSDGTLEITSELIITEAHDTCGDTVEFTNIDPILIDGNDLGDLTINVEIIDTAENVTTGTIDVVIADNTPPVVTCPNDTSFIVPPCQCDSLFTFSDPIAFDENGGVITITRTDTSGLNSGDPFPVGTTTISYEIEDESGNVTACSYDVIIASEDPGPILLKDQLNFSLSENCDGYPTAIMLIEGEPACEEDKYIVSVLDPSGNRIHEDSLRFWRNQVLEVKVEYGCFNNSLTTDILIEDKFSPQITCISDTISCDQVIEFGIPEVTDNCDDEPTIVLLNETLQNVACIDPLLSRIITRTYTSIDDDGRRSDTCFQVLSVSKFDLSTVSFDGIDTLIYCGDLDELDENGNPSPSITGFPTAGSVSLWPDQNAFCGVTSSYEDTEIPGTDCGYSILRVWNVMYWDCFQDGMRQFFQTINIHDNQAPTFSCPDTLRLETDPFTCTADLSMNLPLAQDDCNNGVYFDITYPTGFVENATSIQATLELGANSIIISSRDICGNTNSCEFIVIVEDNEDPIAIVNASFSVNLNDDEAVITANQIDQNSFDECGEVSITINRMDTLCNAQDTLPGNSISVCCEDVGTDVMIQVTITDLSGNTSLAMVSVAVEDNTAPTLSVDLPDITLSCDFPYILGQTQIFGSFIQDGNQRDSILLNAEYVEFSGDPLDGTIQENCGMTVTEEVFDEDVNITCGTGTITRMFTITDNFGNSITADQVITLIDLAPLNSSDIDWPDDYMINDNSVCSPEDIVSQDLPANVQSPIIQDETCSDTGTASIDDVDYGPFVSDTLFIINRQWTISDWCQTENGQFVTFDSTQMITVLNTGEPSIIGGCSDITECNFSPTCEDKEISVSIDAIDDCTENEQLIFTYEIDINNNGSVDESGTGNNFTSLFPIGIHRIQWTVTDLQGNADICFQFVTIENCNFPSPVCLLNPTFALTAVDTDNDGILDAEILELIPADIDGGSSNSCGVPFSLSFSPDINHTDTLFDCDDLGEQLLMLYITDMETGIQDFCETLINIIDTNSVDICDEAGIQMLTISGTVKSEMGDPTDGPVVSLAEYDMSSTCIEGAYMIESLTPGNQYYINPSYETYAVDGITTLDLIKIQKHILGIEPLDSPYKLLAADANGSQSINGADIIALRKLLLGHYSELPSQKSWQFVPESHVFTDEYNPWSGLADMYEVPSLQENIEVDFVALKTGDVNNSSANLSGIKPIIRSTMNMEYEVIIQPNEYIIPVKIDDFNKIEGFQFSFRYNYNGFQFKEFISGNIDIAEGFYSTKDIDLGVIDISWTEFQNSDFDTDNSENVDFYIVFERKNPAFKEDINLIVFSEGLDAQAYYTDGETKNIRFREKEDAESEIQLFQNKPNPWNKRTAINFLLPNSQFTSISIYDVTGKEVYKQEAVYHAGMNEIVIEASALGTAGIYYYSLKTNEFQNMKKMILLD